MATFALWPAGLQDISRDTPPKFSAAVGKAGGGVGERSPLGTELPPWPSVRGLFSKANRLLPAPPAAAFQGLQRRTRSQPRAGAAALAPPRSCSLFTKEFRGIQAHFPPKPGKGKTVPNKNRCLAPPVSAAALLCTGGAPRTSGQKPPPKDTGKDTGKG